MSDADNENDRVVVTVDWQCLLGTDPEIVADALSNSDVEAVADCEIVVEPTNQTVRLSWSAGDGDALAGWLADASRHLPAHDLPDAGEAAERLNAVVHDRSAQAVECYRAGRPAAPPSTEWLYRHSDDDNGPRTETLAAAYRATSQWLAVVPGQISGGTLAWRMWCLREACRRELVRRAGVDRPPCSECRGTAWRVEARPESPVVCRDCGARAGEEVADAVRASGDRAVTQLATVSVDATGGGST